MSDYLGTAISSGMVQMDSLINKMDSFKEGATTLTKEDVITTEPSLEARGLSTSDDLNIVIERYEIIDKNGNGISYKELTNFAGDNSIEIQDPIGGRPPVGPPPERENGGTPPPEGQGPPSPSGVENQPHIESLINQYLKTDHQEAMNHFTLYL